MLWRGGARAAAGAGAGAAVRGQTRQAAGQARTRLTLDDMPAPRGLPVVGTTLAFLLAGSAPRLHEYVDRRHRELGPVFRDSIGPVTAVFVADPTEMRRTFGLEGKHPIHLLPEPWILYNQLHGCKRGLFFMDGEDWLRMRKKMNRLMLKPEQADIFTAPCERVADSLVSQWKRSNVMTLHNLEGQLYRWSLDTIVASLLGSQYEVHARKWDSDLNELAAVVHHVFLESGRMSVISAKHARALHLPVWKRFVKAVDTSLNKAQKLVLEMIESCANGPKDGLLPQMLQADIAHQDVVKIVVDLIIAAGDTTALSTQWALYLLAKNSEVQTQVATEVTHSKDFMRSPLLRGVVREALRLFPVAPFLTRIMPDSCVIGGFELPPMQIVLLSLYTSGRDPQNFPEPERFWPERWSREIESTTESSNAGAYTAVYNPHASLPFAIGARSCIGKKLAEAQMIVTLAKVLQSFKLDLLNTEDVNMVLRLVAVPSVPLQIRLTPR